MLRTRNDDIEAAHAKLVDAEAELERKAEIYKKNPNVPAKKGAHTKAENKKNDILHRIDVSTKARDVTLQAIHQALLFSDLHIVVPPLLWTRVGPTYAGTSLCCIPYSLSSPHPPVRH